MPVAAELHEGEQAEAAAVEHRLVALDDALLLQPPDAAPAGRLAERDLLGELRVGQASVPLQAIQDFGIDAVEFGHS